MARFKSWWRSRLVWTILALICAIGGTAISVVKARPTDELPLAGICLDHAPSMSLVNSRRLRLNYEIQDAGPSGVRNVELWATRDGKIWQRFSDEAPTPGPLNVHVAEEGKYGFTLVVRNGAGLVGPRPKPGDVPQMWVEVDETPPTVQIHEARVGTDDQAGQLIVRWRASDLHLESAPVTIRVSPRREGPWTTIATGLPNSGRHAYPMTKDMPHRFFVLVEAADKAGNVGSVRTGDPILYDATLPRGIIRSVGVTPAPVAELRPLGIEEKPSR